MNRKFFEDVINRDFDGVIAKVLIAQLDNFCELEKHEFPKHNYRVGDEVVLKKDTFLHGLGKDVSLDVFDKLAQDGLINKDFELGASRHKIHHAVSLWHMMKKIKLKDYIVFYSGMEVMIDNHDYKVVPFGKLDEFVLKMRNYPHWSWTAESTMEIRFMPSLAKERNQIAFIFNGSEKAARKLTALNLNDEKVPLEICKGFMNFSSPEREKMWVDAHRRIGPDERIAYVVFGLPRNMIEGVLVGRKFEKNKKILDHIKAKLPHCYICNLDGKVVRE